MSNFFEQYEDKKAENIQKFKGSRLSSKQWQDMINDGVKIIDYDGWDRSNFDKSWLEEISLTEFYLRRDMSTTSFPLN